MLLALKQRLLLGAQVYHTQIAVSFVSATHTQAFEPRPVAMKVSKPTTHTHTHAHAHARTHTHTHTHTHAHTHRHTRTHTRTNTLTNIHSYTQTRTNVSTCTQKHMDSHKPVHTHAYTCFHPHSCQPLVSTPTPTTRANLNTNCSQFLTPVPVWELKHIRKLSHLCAISYKLPTVTRRALKRKHGLDLIVASWVGDAENAAALLEVG